MSDDTHAFLNAEVREGEQLYVQPPEGWNPMILMDCRRVVWKVRKAMVGLRTSPRRLQEHLSGKLKEHGFDQDERDPCQFANTELDFCIGVHVDDMLAVGPSVVTKNLLQELAKDQDFRIHLARCLDKRDQGHEAFVSDDTHAFLNAEVRKGEQLYVQPPDGWNPMILMDGRRVVWKVRKAMVGLRTSPRRLQEHLSGKLKEHGFDQDERDPCQFANTELDICIRHAGCGSQCSDEEFVAGTRERYGNALEHGD